MTDDPGRQHGRRAFRRSQWESKNVDRSEAIVTLRKLVHLCFGVCKNRRPYQADYAAAA